MPQVQKAATQIWKIQDLSSKIRQIRKETPVELQKVKFIIRHCKYFAVSWLSVDIRIVSFHDQVLWVFECLLIVSRASFIDVHLSVDLHIPAILDQYIIIFEALLISRHSFMMKMMTCIEVLFFQPYYKRKSHDANDEETFP